LGFQRGVYLDSGVTCDRCGDAAPEGFQVFAQGRLLSLTRAGSACLFNHFGQHSLEFPAFQTDRRGFDGESSGAKGLGFEAVFFQFVGDIGKNRHLPWLQIDQERHEQSLTLDGLHIAAGQDLFKEYPLMGDMLVDDPKAVVVDGEDEGVAELAERPERTEIIEVGLLAIRLDGRR
jgi:hypothetical protein